MFILVENDPVGISFVLLLSCLNTSVRCVDMSSLGLTDT